MQLTKSFKIDEFTKSAGIIINPTDEQIHCIQILCDEILQPIRNIFGKVQVNAGLRTTKTTEKLIKQGYAASQTSDHIAWSKDNPTGTGAADITLDHDLQEVFDWIIDEKYHLCKQIIYYPSQKFIHVSNHYNLIFTQKDPTLEKNRVLISKNKKLIPYPRRPLIKLKTII